MKNGARMFAIMGQYGEALPISMVSPTVRRDVMVVGRWNT
jgi:hypothetical protein